MNILFIIFNRPDTTKEVFAAIRVARPERLFIAADGPRANRSGEAEKCQATRDIVKNIDWPCQVEVRLQTENMGCKRHVSSAISWFFEHVEEGIILEDDTVPDQTFFAFTTAMLAKYRDNTRVMHVSGTTFVPKSHVSDKHATYHFSRYDSVWGWATWRRAWQSYDIDMRNIDTLSIDPTTFGRARDRKFWTRFFKHMKEKRVDTWDAQWLYSIRVARGVCITPNINLVHNIGFGVEATHTKTGSPGHLPVIPMHSIIAPPREDVDERADSYLMDTVYIRSLPKKIYSKIRSLLLD